MASMNFSRSSSYTTQSIGDSIDWNVSSTIPAQYGQKASTFSLSCKGVVSGTASSRDCELAVEIQLSNGSWYEIWDDSYYLMSSTTGLSGTFNITNATIPPAIAVTIGNNSITGISLIQTGDRSIRGVSGGNGTLTINYVDYHTSVTAPTAVSASANSAPKGGAVTLSWSGAGAGINNAIAGYQVQYDENSNGIWTNYGGTTTSTSLGVVASTSPNTIRRFRVGAINSATGFSTPYSDATAPVRSYVDVGVVSFTAPASGARIALNPTNGALCSWNAASYADTYYYSVYDANGILIQGEATTTSTSYTIPASLFNTAGRALQVRVRAYNSTDKVFGGSVSSNFVTTNTPPVLNASNNFSNLTLDGATISPSNNIYSIPKGTNSRTIRFFWPAATDFNGDGLSYFIYIYKNGTPVVTNAPSSNTYYDYTGVFDTVGDIYTLYLNCSDGYNTASNPKLLSSSVVVAQMVSSCSISLESVDTDITNTYYQSFVVRAQCDVIPTSFTFQYSTNGGTTYTDIGTVTATSINQIYTVNGLQNLTPGQTIWVRAVATAYNTINSSTIMVYKVRPPEIISYIINSSSSSVIGTTGEALNRGMTINDAGENKESCYKNVDTTLNMNWPAENIPLNLTTVSNFSKYNIDYSFVYSATVFPVGNLDISKNTSNQVLENSIWALDWNNALKVSRFNNSIISNIVLRANLKCYYNSANYITVTQDTPIFSLNFKSPPVFTVNPTDGRILQVLNDKYVYSGDTLQIQNVPIAIDTNRTLSNNDAMAYQLRTIVYDNTTQIDQFDLSGANFTYEAPSSIDNYKLKTFKVFLLALDDSNLSSTISNEFNIFDSNGTTQKTTFGFKGVPLIEVYDKTRDSNEVCYFVRIANTGANLQLTDNDALWATSNNITSATMKYDVKTSPSGEVVSVDINKTAVTKTTLANEMTGSNGIDYVVSAVSGKPGSYKITIASEAVGESPVYCQITFSNGFFSFVTAFVYISGTEPDLIIHKSGGVSVRTKSLRAKTALSIKDQGGAAIVDLYDEDSATIIGSIVKTSPTLARFVGSSDTLTTERNFEITGGVSAEAIPFNGSDDVVFNVTGIDSTMITGLVPINKGGTNASTAANARINLGAAGALYNSSSGYYVLTPPNGSASSFLCTPTPGLLSFAPNTGAIGDATWYFSAAYVTNYYGTWNGNNVAINRGGTGANTAKDARINLSTIGAENANGYWGIAAPDGNASDYIRTTTSGLIPSSSTSITSTLGTEALPFMAIYGQELYGNLNGASLSTAWVNVNNTLTYGASGLNYFNQSLDTGNSPTTNQAPYPDWWHMIRMNHENPAGYYADIALSFSENYLGYRRIASGVSTPWIKVYDTASIIYSSTPPAGQGGMIWLKPV